MAKVVAKAKIVRCQKCGRGLSEHYGFLVLVRYRGHRSLFYGPGRAVVMCPNCGVNCEIEVAEN